LMKGAYASIVTTSSAVSIYVDHLTLHWLILISGIILVIGLIMAAYGFWLMNKMFIAQNKTISTLTRRIEILENIEVSVTVRDSNGDIFEPVEPNGDKDLH